MTSLDLIECFHQVSLQQSCAVVKNKHSKNMTEIFRKAKRSWLGRTMCRATITASLTGPWKYGYAYQPD